jgi:CheY-like chemotaxis protein
MLKVLIVDDSKIMRNIVSVRIKECGFKVELWWE